MKKTIFLLLITPAFYGSAEGQQIRKITGVKTYFSPEKDSIPPTLIDSNLVLEYDREGRLLRDQDVEGVCYQYYRYDEQGRLITDNSYCGEGFMECTITYKGHLKFDTCYTALYSTTSIDSLNEKGQPVKSVSKTIEWGFDASDTSRNVYQNISYYQYDADGRETESGDIDSTGNRIWRVKQKYNEKGLLVLHTSRYNEIMGDSVIYHHDENGRVTHAQKFCYPNKNNQYEVVHDLHITYPVTEIKKSERIQKMNKPLLESLPYSMYDFNISYSSPPTEMKYVVTDQYSSDGYMGKDLVFTYSYDKKGRLEEIRGTGTHTGAKKYDLTHRISYQKPDKAVLIRKEDDSSGFPVTGDIYEYENGLLKKISEKDRTGFTHAVLVYTYEFYK